MWVLVGWCNAFELWERSELNISKLILDGAPLEEYGFFLTSVMTSQYLMLTHKAQIRDNKILKGFDKNFLPSKYLNDYLKIVDNMSDQSIRNMIMSVGQNNINNVKKNGEGVLFIHGTKLNEFLSIRSVYKLKKHYKKMVVHKCHGSAHCYLALYKPRQWVELVSSFMEI